MFCLDEMLCPDYFDLSFYLDTINILPYVENIKNFKTESKWNKNQTETTDYTDNLKKGNLVKILC